MKRAAVYILILLCAAMAGCGVIDAAVQPVVSEAPEITPSPTPVPTPAPTPVPTPEPVVEQREDYGYTSVMMDAAVLMGRYGDSMYLHKACQTYCGRSIPCIELGRNDAALLVLCAAGAENQLMCQLEEMLTGGLDDSTSLCIVPMPYPDGGEWEEELELFIEEREFGEVIWFEKGSDLREIAAR